MQIRTDETDKPSADTLHVFIEAKAGGNSVCVDITGKDEWAEKLRDVLTKAIEKFRG